MKIKKQVLFAFFIFHLNTNFIVSTNTLRYLDSDVEIIQATDKIQKTLSETLAEIELNINDITVVAQNNFNSFCDQKCEGCAYHKCSNNININDNIKCDKSYGTPDFCLNCKGRRIDNKKTVSRHSYFSNTSDVDVETSICYANTFDSKLIEVANRNLNQKWVYVGYFTGFFTQTPLAVGCGNYDPRLRPWYIQASLGEKHYLLLIETSSSNLSSQEKEISKLLVKSLIKNMTYLDRLSVVTYNNQGFEIIFNIEVSTNNQPKILEDIEKSYTQDSVIGDHANLYLGLEKAYDLLISNKDNLTIKDILVVNISKGNHINTNIKKLVQTKQSSLENFLFTPINFKIGDFIIGSENYLKDVCAKSNFTSKTHNNFIGAYYEIKLMNDIDKSLLLMYKFLASITKNKNLFWSEPYIDLSGIGKIVTVSKAIYTEDNFLVGVIGIDIRINYLLAYGEIDKISQELKSRSKNSTENLVKNMTTCQIDGQRDIKCFNCKDNTFFNSFDPSEISANYKYTTGFKSCPVSRQLKFCTVEDKKGQITEFTPLVSVSEELTCCKCRSKEDLGIIIVGWVLFALVFLMLIFISIKSNNNNEHSSDNEKIKLKTKE